MLRGLALFGLGVYVGLYLDQNYEVQRVDDPQQIFDKIKSFVNDVLNDDKKK